MSVAGAAYLNELYERIPVGVFVIAPDGQVALANRAFRMLTGSDDIERWIDRLEGGEQQATRAAWQACRANGELLRRDIPALAPDGHRLWLRLRAVRLDDGAVAGTLADVTEIEQARVDAASASRAKSEFLTNMSHEIRTPLSSIVGVGDLLWETDLDTAQRRYVGVLREASEHLLTLINDMLDLSRIEAGGIGLEKQEFNLREQMDKSVDLVAGRARAKRLQVHCRVAPDVPHIVVGDPLRLRQVLVNLLVNAVKFTERGEVVARVERAPGGRSLRFLVTDTGIGIAADHLERIFLPFEQADPTVSRRYGGTGLGLSISRRLIELMGGRIFVESEPGRGSTFGFDLALPALEGVTSRPSHAAVNIRGVRVLVADENDTGRLILREMLAGWGAQVDGVDSPARTIARLEGGSFDVLLLACESCRDEDQLLRSIRARWPASKLVIILVASELPMGSDLRDLSVQALLLKPVRRRELIEALGTALSDAEFVAERPQRAPIVMLPEPLRILLADDSPDNQLLVRAFLGPGDHRLDTVGDGRAAVVEAARHRYDLILMDLQMPVLDGLSAIREIRRHERETGVPPTPILVLTAHGMPEHERASREAGADGHVVRPLRRPTLLKAIADAVGVAVPPSGGRVHVDVTSTLAPLVPNFLANRGKDVQAARAALRRRDFHGLWVLAHTMKGLGASYGFDGISDIGVQLERAALAHEEAGALRAIEALESYLGRVDYAVSA